ncbi:uncharacterized protein LOC133914622 [Phragmites australis]|uniref:uncharacterized protein LOC133914622 n=1 Tax=Phragmites australis TaxID=29695 RepID=UPI002D776E30|nr:uncharacterized protein LOC133914622 [Phragmites australis]
MANYLLTALDGPAWSWLFNLPPNPIRSWAELKDQFIANFQGTFEHLGTKNHLHQLNQGKDESLQDFIWRFGDGHNTISDISDESVIIAFKRGIKDIDLVTKLDTRNIQMVKELFELADNSAKRVES